MKALISGGAFAAVVVVLSQWLHVFDLPMEGQPQYMGVLKPLLALVGSMLADWLSPKSTIRRLMLSLTATVVFVASVTLFEGISGGPASIVSFGAAYPNGSWIAMLVAYFSLGVAIWPISVWMTNRRWRLSRA